MCPWYDELAPVFANKAFVAPSDTRDSSDGPPSLGKLCRVLPKNRSIEVFDSEDGDDGDDERPIEDWTETQDEHNQEQGEDRGVTECDFMAQSNLAESFGTVPNSPKLGLESSASSTLPTPGPSLSQYASESDTQHPQSNSNARKRGTTAPVGGHLPGMYFYAEI